MRVGARTCDVWAVHNDGAKRLKEAVLYGHARHACVRERQFAQEHEGEHRCSCGLEWAKQDTDND